MTKVRIIILIGLLHFNIGEIISQEASNEVSLIETYTLEDLISMKISTASRNNQKIEDVPANVEVITKDVILKYGFRDLNELLQHITGIYKIEDHYWLGSSNYGVRGYFKTGPFSNVAILINGVNQVSDKYSDYPDVKITLPVEAIERIEVIKGPMAVVYGNGAFFGVINIITNQTELSQDNHIVAEHGTPNNSKLFLQLTEGKDNFKFKYVASYDHDDGLNVPYTSLTTDTALLQYVGLNAQSTTGGQLALTRYYTGLNLIYKKLSIDLSYNQSDKGVFDGSPSFNNGNYLKTQATNTSITYKETLGKYWKAQGLINFYTHNHILNYELFRKYYYEIDAQNTNAISAELTVDYTPSDRFLLTGNISRRTVNSILQISDFGYYGLNYGDGKAGLPKGETYSTTSGYLQAQYKLREKLTFLAGIRVEHLEPYNMYVSRGVVSEDPNDNRDPNDPANRYVIESKYVPENNGFTYIPRISAIYKPFDKHIFKLMYGESQKQPSFSENYRQLPKSRPPLSASKIQTIELNYYSYAIKRIILNSSLFINKLDNLIENTNVRNTETGEWEIYSTNSGGYITKGFEGQIIYKPTEKLEFDTRFIIQKTNDLKNGYENIEVAYSPQFIGYLYANYMLIKNFTVAASFQYIDKMQTAWETESIPEAGARIGLQSPSNIMASLNLLYQNLFNKNIYTGLKIGNLLNTEVRYPTTLSNKWIDKGALNQHISFNFKMGIIF